MPILLIAKFHVKHYYKDAAVAKLADTRVLRSGLVAIGPIDRAREKDIDMGKNEAVRILGICCHEINRPAIKANRV